MLSPLLLGRAKVALAKNLLAGDDVALEHLSEEDVVDLNIMRREPVVQERRREHHVVSVEPELDAILGVESVLLTRLGESAASEDEGSREAVDHKSGVVEMTIARTEEARTNGTHSTHDLEHSHPEEVSHAEDSVKRMGRVLTGSDLESLEEATDGTSSLGETLIDDVLERRGVFQ